MFTCLPEFNTERSVLFLDFMDLSVVLLHFLVPYNYRFDDDNNYDDEDNMDDINDNNFDDNNMNNDIRFRR